MTGTKVTVANARPYLKALHYVAVALVAGGFAIPFFNGQGPNGVTLIAAAGSLGVYLKKNTPTQPWARFVVTLYTATISTLVAAATTNEGVLMGFSAISTTEWQQIILVALGGLTVLSASDETGPIPPSDGVVPPEVSTTSRI